MGFGYISLSAKSEQDNYLVGNPQFTFFKAVYRKHTNFAIDYQIHRFPTDANDLTNKKIYMNIPKNGDLLHKLYLMLDITTVSDSDITNLPPFIYNLFEYIDISIGGQLIDRHYSSWFAIWHDLLEDGCTDVILADMISIKNNYTTAGTKTLTLPLKFWFNNNIGLALPLIALQSTEVKLDIKFSSNVNSKRFARGNYNDDGSEVGTDAVSSINNVKLLIQYIHLDKDERRVFSSNNHEYLITQVQNSLNNPIYNYTSLYSSRDFESIFHKVELRLTYPVKQIYWTIQDLLGSWDANGNYYENTGVHQFNYWNNYSFGTEQINLCNILINGKELTEELDANFFRNIQQYNYMPSNGIPDVDVSSTSSVGYPAVADLEFNKGVGVYSYSFSLYPNNYQPSGSINFSQIDNAQLRFSLKQNSVLTAGAAGNGSFTNKNVNIYAINYNVLRIMSGMAGLAFIN